MKILLSFALLLSCLVACSDDEVAPPGGACGGFASTQCGAGEYCDYPQNSCGVADETGTCRPRPDACPLLLVAEPTCGCDGEVYGSPCDARLAGTDLNAGGSCTLAKDSFECGYRQCGLGNQYCRYAPSDIGGEAADYECGGLGSCTTCDCLEAQPCGETCAGDASTGLTLTCPAG